MFTYEEDLQYFQEKVRIAPKEKKEICENAIRLLEQAHEIYVPTKKKLNK